MSEHEGVADGRPVDALALGEFIEGGDQFGARTITGHERAPAERTPRERDHPVTHAAIEGAVAQRTEEGRRVLGLAGGERHLQVSDERVVLIGGVVGDADGPDLAFGHQRSERVGHLHRVGEHVGPMDLVEVDHVDAEATEAGIDGRAQIGIARVVGNGGHDPALGGEHHAVTQLGGGSEHTTQHFLVAPESRAPVVEAVDIGGVDEVHAEVERGLDEGLRLALVGGGEAPAAEAEGPDGIEAGREGSGAGPYERVAHPRMLAPP